MKKIVVLSGLVLCSFSFSKCTLQDLERTAGSVLSQSGSGGKLGIEQIGMGLKEALTNGLDKGVKELARENGFFGNAALKILFPDKAQKVEKTLRDIGAGQIADNVILKINRAAEDAASSAGPIFLNAIKQMTFDDAANILMGEDNAATNFFKRTTTQQLYSAFNPVIKNSLSKVQALKVWEDAINTYNKVPLVQKVNPSLDDYVTNKAIDGLFHMVANEEKNIRRNPVARTTDLLKKVFSKQDASRK